WMRAMTEQATGSVAAGERTPAPRFLILETSGRIGYVGLAEGGELGDVRRLDESRRHARDLAPAGAKLLAARGWRPRDLDTVIASRGPGSYTGLRVGLMSAKALAYATGCALLAVETFAAIAEQAPPEAALLDVLADAQQQNLYVQRWQRAEGGDWQPASSLAIQSVADWVGALAPNVWVSGPGLTVCATQIPAANPLVKPEARDPLPQSLLKAGLRRWHAGERDELWALEPLYLR